LKQSSSPLSGEENAQRLKDYKTPYREVLKPTTLALAMMQTLSILKEIEVQGARGEL